MHSARSIGAVGDFEGEFKFGFDDPYTFQPAWLVVNRQK